MGVYSLRSGFLSCISIFYARGSYLNPRGHLKLNTKDYFPFHSFLLPSLSSFFCFLSPALQPQLPVFPALSMKHTFSPTTDRTQSRPCSCPSIAFSEYVDDAFGPAVGFP